MHFHESLRILRPLCCCHEKINNLCAGADNYSNCQYAAWVVDLTDILTL